MYVLVALLGHDSTVFYGPFDTYEEAERIWYDTWVVSGCCDCMYPIYQIKEI